MELMKIQLVLFGIMFLLIAYQVSSQEEGVSKEFAYRSFSISPLGIYAGGNIGFPIGARLQFMFGPRYSMGVGLGANINSIETIGTVGLVLQWNRKRN